MIPIPQTPDDAARERIRTSLDESLLVEASAGTGKTSELVRRIVNLLASGRTTIGRIVAVTFTHKAAGELKLRLRQELDRARSGATPETAAALEHALAHLEEASIGTIHSFCAQILRERPVEAGVDPDFQELDETGASRVYATVFRRWFEEQLNHESPGLRRALARLAAREERDTNTTAYETILRAGWTILEWRDFPRPWTRPQYDREAVIDQLVEYIEALAPRIGHINPRFSDPVRDIVPYLERKPRDYDLLEGFLFRLWKAWKRQNKKVPDERLFEAIENFRPVADADLAEQLRGELWQLTELYSLAKRRAGQLDFVDLLLLARDLIKSNATVRGYLQTRYTHLFVDEFQDTDPLQAEILLLLSANNPVHDNWFKVTPVPGKLFLVGDPKQSIYKFRRADVHLYQAIQLALQARGVGMVTLSRSFRSVPAIQQAVNAAFAPELNGDGEAAQAQYVPLTPFRGEPDHGQPAVIALPVPRPYGKYRISKMEIAGSLPQAVTGFVEWLVKESGWRVTDPDSPGTEVLIQPSHICVLFRRFTNWGVDVTRDYVRSLEDRGIPHLLVGSKTFHWREEIDTIRAALTAVEWPEDQLAVYATLRGALFAIPDHHLLQFKLTVGSFEPLKAPQDALPEHLKPVGDALALLGELHRERNVRPIAETVYRLLEATRAWAAFAFRPAGNQVLSNVRRVIDLARKFETTAGFSFRGFVEEMTSQAEKTESSEAPVLEEGADGVRLMTVHAAKGLEFPVVILADITANLAHETPDKYVETPSGLCAMRLMGCAPLELLENEALEKKREGAEGVRVAYVAATRARDLLVVPAVGDAEQPGWVSPLNKALYPDSELRRVAEPAPRCPKFGTVSVLNRPAEYAEETSVRPGLHRSRVGALPVVWWDPTILPPGREQFFSDRQVEIFSDHPVAVEAEMAAYQQWLTSRAAVRQQAAQPSIELLLASEAQQTPEGFLGEIGFAQTPRHANRPGGKRFGALIHNVLRDIPLSASREQVQATVKLQARLLAAEDDELEEAVFAVHQALLHPLLARARGAARLHREYPIVYRTDTREALEGVIDLAFEENGQWVVIDFKTDSDLAGIVMRYRAQLAWYATALESITKRPVQPYILAV